MQEKFCYLHVSVTIGRSSNPDLSHYSPTYFFAKSLYRVFKYAFTSHWTLAVLQVQGQVAFLRLPAVANRYVGLFPSVYKHVSLLVQVDAKPATHKYVDTGDPC